MKNLLQETLTALESYGYLPDQIVFIGSLETAHACTWFEFKELANVDYDETTSRHMIASDLVIVFDDSSRFWRVSDGHQEWWQYYRGVQLPTQTLPIYSLVNRPTLTTRDTLEAINHCTPAKR